MVEEETAAHEDAAMAAAAAETVEVREEEAREAAERSAEETAALGMVEEEAAAAHEEAAMAAVTMVGTSIPGGRGVLTDSLASPHGPLAPPVPLLDAPPPSSRGPPSMSGLPPGWQRVQPDSGAAYFWNTATGEVTWDPPLGIRQPPVPQVNTLGFMAAGGSQREANPWEALGKPPTCVYAAPGYPPPAGAAPPRYPPPAGPPPGGPPPAFPPPGGPPPGGPPPGFPPRGGPPPGGPPPGFPPPGAPPPGGPPPAGPPGGGAPPAKAPEGGKVETTESQHRLRATPYLARNFAVISNGLQLWLAFIMAMVGSYNSNINDPILGIGHQSPYGWISILIAGAGGGGMMFLEYCSWGRDKVIVSSSTFVVRALIYGGLSVPGFLTALTQDSLMPPILGSCYWLITAVTFAIASTAAVPTEKEWAWKLLPGAATEKQKKVAEERGGKYYTSIDSLRSLYREWGEKNTLPRKIFLCMYFVVNVVLFWEAFVRHANSEKGKALRGEPFRFCLVDSLPYPCKSSNNTAPANPILQDIMAGVWFPWAKGFGQMLNFNCAVMVLPVVRSLVMWLHNATSIRAPWFLAWIPAVMPLDKNVVLHKATAKYFILVAVFGHASAHYFNYGAAPYYNKALDDHNYARSPSVMAWDPWAPGAGPSGVSAGFTGEVLMICMLIIYGGAHEKVKRAHYETFWYTHHTFIVWFTFLLFHGPVFYLWALPCLLPYVVDRLIIRIFYRGNKRMALARVYFWGKPERPDVITLQFDNAVSDKGVKPLQYMEGHYLYLQCPAVDNRLGPLREWHPFTISSAPDEPILEVNIRIMPSPHSWTNKVTQYLRLLDPENKGEVELYTRNPTTGNVTLGKVFGPDGRPFFRVDAPHGAPSQHVFRYRTSMLVGAGIGVTPCASIMKGVVGYRWKKGFSPSNLHFFWVARRSDLTTFKWLLLMLPQLKAQELQHNEFYGGDAATIQAMENRVKVLKKELGNGKEAALPPGWSESKTEDGHTYYWNMHTNETSWSRPVAPPSSDINKSAVQAELLRTQETLAAASAGNRSLSITLYLTGCKKEEVQPDPSAKPESPAGLITALLSATDAEGKPYVVIKAGRPDWKGEFKALADKYGKEEIGVVFCGAPMIAAALKEQCEEQSSKGGTLFRLHKENF
ncbi:hypothetical protein AB1Y20_003619 [Prymnesium parvum]|uniref:Uncharacterized protein n=1 Tax=Prymnesium parvum TaxID=97485 RepID=A0AB34J725_PRYPA